MMSFKNTQYIVPSPPVNPKINANDKKVSIPATAFQGLCLYLHHLHLLFSGRKLRNPESWLCAKCVNECHDIFHRRVAFHRV